MIYIPLSCIIMVTALKDLLEDNQRKKSDTEENNRPVLKVQNSNLVTCPWKQLRVGDIVKVTSFYSFFLQIHKDEYFPCDLIMLGSSDIKGVAYIETKNLDGETNLKHRFAPKALRKILETQEDVKYEILIPIVDDGCKSKSSVRETKSLSI